MALPPRAPDRAGRHGAPGSKARAGRARLGAGLLLGVLLSVVACGGMRSVEGKRPLGAISRAFVDGAELRIRYSYEPAAGRALELHVDVTALSGDAGELAFELEPVGFEIVGAGSSFELHVPAGATESRRVRLRVLGAFTTPLVTVVATRRASTVEVARDVLRFVVREGELRECLTDEERCGEPEH